MKGLALKELLLGNSLRLTGVICCILLMSGCCKIFNYGNQFTRENQNVVFGKNYQPQIKGLNTQGYFYRKGEDKLGWYSLLVLYSDGRYFEYIPVDSYIELRCTPVGNLSPLIRGCHNNGFYIIINDTLVLDEYLLLCGSRSLISRQYVIEDSNTLHLVKRILHDKKGKRKISEEDDTLHFVPVDTLPDTPESWLKKQKWMWENKDEWKDYKRELKARKDSIKRARKLKTDNQ